MTQILFLWDQTSLKALLNGNISFLVSYKINGACFYEWGMSLSIWTILLSREPGAYSHQQTKIIGIVFETSIPKNCMMTIFVLKNIIHTGNYWLLLGRYIRQRLYLSMGRIMALQQMIDKKNTFLFIWLSLSVPPVWDKTFKIATNYLYLLSVADDRKLSK